MSFRLQPLGCQKPMAAMFGEACMHKHVNQSKAECVKFRIDCHTGNDPWAVGYQKLMAAMLGEADMHGHKDAHATVWLAAVLPVLQVQTEPEKN